MKQVTLILLQKRTYRPISAWQCMHGTTAFKCNDQCNDWPG